MMLMALFSAPSGIKIDYNNYNYGYNFNFNNTSCIPAGHLYPTNLIPAANHKRLRRSRSRSLTSIPQTTRSYRRFNHTRAETAETMATTEKLGIKIVHNPPESKLAELGVRSWSKWGCPPSKFPWTYSSKETCYLLKGKVKVYPDPDKCDEAVEIGAGDLVVFPKGMSCTWDVSETVDKHYIFE